VTSEPDTAEESVAAGPVRRRGLGALVLDTRPLRVVPFRRLWASTAVTAIGSQLTAVAVPKQVYDITNSSGYVGLAGAVALVPLLVFGLWGGAIADTVDRRKLLVVTNLGIAVTSLLLWAQAAAHLNSVWVVLALVTGIEVYLGYLQLQPAVMLSVLVALSIFKVGLIVAYFMHLKYERFSMTLTLIPATIFCIMMMIVFFFHDSQRILLLGTQNGLK